MDKEEQRRIYAEKSFEFAFRIIERIINYAKIAKALGDKSGEIEEAAKEIYKKAYYAKITFRGVHAISAAAILVASERAGIKGIEIRDLIPGFEFRENDVIGAKKAIKKMLKKSVNIES